MIHITLLRVIQLTGWLVIWLTLSLSGVSWAEEREFVLRWLPSTGTSATGYRIYLGAGGGSFSRPLDLGAVAPGSDGIARASLLLDAATSYRAAMTAYNQAGESSLSNVIQIAALACDLARCRDANPCTVDACGASGCSHAAAPDGTLCGSFDVCSAGVCQPAQCLAAFGCDDRNRCNGTEICTTIGRCLAGSPLQCAPSTECAASSCDALLGCRMVAYPDGALCDDGRKETTRDRCRAGVCTGDLKRGRR